MCDLCEKSVTVHVECVCPRSHDRLAGGGKGWKISSWCHGVYKGWGGGLGGGASASSYHQVYYYTSIFNFKPTKTSIYLQCLQNKQPTTKMNNFDCHPRVLSLSSASTPSSSIPTTPFLQSRRQSHESAHDAHHFVNQEEKTQHKLNLSIKKMWEGVKRHAVEHHKSVNAAYMASYGCGTATAANTTGGKAS